MSTFTTQLGHGAPYVSINIECYEQSYNIAGNYSIMYWRAYVNIWSGTRTGSWDWNAYVNGTYVGGGSVSPSNWSGVHDLGSGTIIVYHDANGYANPSCSSYLDDYYGQSTASGNPGTTRLPLAPTIYGNVADTIKPVSARIGTEISSLGHGTSAATHMFYRVAGGSWTQTADQGDVGDYNYWTITGLKPGKTYEYYSVWWNNMDDTATSGTNTFKTKGLSGMIPVLMGIIG